MSIISPSGHQVGYPRSGCRSSGTLGLVAALPEEARSIARGIDRRQQVCRDGVTVIRGALGGPEVALAWAGMGAAAAVRATECLLSSGVVAIAVVGFAGALVTHLQAGDALAATHVIDARGERWDADSGLLTALGAECPLHTPCGPSGISRAARLHFGPLLTSSRIVTAAAEKRRLGEETGAVAVDMESGAVMRRAAEAGVRAIALRVITDGVDETIAIDFSLCCDSHGQLHRPRLVRMLARRPAALMGMVRLARQSARAGRTLAELLGWYVPRVAGCQPVDGEPQTPWPGRPAVHDPSDRTS